MRPGRVLRGGDLPPAEGGSFTAAYGQPELARDTPRLPPERRRATGSPSGLDRPLDHPSGRDPTVPRTAGRTKNGRSPDGSGGGPDSSASCRGCTSSFACLAWGPTGAIDSPGLLIAIAFASSASELPVLPRVVGRDPQRRRRGQPLLANSLVAVGRYTGLTLGPILEGLLVATVGPEWVFVANATSCPVSVA